MKIKDMSFVFYSGSGVYFGGDIRGGCLKLESEVWGDYDSEGHYDLTKEETEKLFELITPEEFIELGRSERLLGVLEFFEKNGIKYSEFVF